MTCSSAFLPQKQPPSSETSCRKRLSPLVLQAALKASAKQTRERLEVTRDTKI